MWPLITVVGSLSTHGCIPCLSVSQCDPPPSGRGLPHSRFLSSYRCLGFPSSTIKTKDEESNTSDFFPMCYFTIYPKPFRLISTSIPFTVDIPGEVFHNHCQIKLQMGFAFPIPVSAYSISISVFFSESPILTSTSSASFLCLSFVRIYLFVQAEILPHLHAFLYIEMDNWSR